MTKEEFKLRMFKNFIGFNKLPSIGLVKDATGCDLLRGKKLIELVYRDEWEINIDLFILNFNIMWRELTKEEKLKVKKYVDRN